MKSVEECFHEELIHMLEKNFLSEISVSKLCKNAGKNRASFYEKYEDIYDCFLKCIDLEVDAFLRNKDTLDDVEQYVDYMASAILLKRKVILHIDFDNKHVMQLYQLSKKMKEASMKVVRKKMENIGCQLPERELEWVNECFLGIVRSFASQIMLQNEQKKMDELRDKLRFEMVFYERALHSFVIEKQKDSITE